MGIDSTKHFDAPRPAFSLAAVDLLRSNWGAALAMISVTTVALTIATAWFLFDAYYSATVDASIAATPISVLLKVQTPPVETQALGVRILALPNVATAVLRNKDDALKTLIAAGLPVSESRNPLPDVWVVGVKPTLLNASQQSLTTFIAETRYLLGGLPGVESTAVDERWVATLDRWSQARRQWRPRIAGIIFLFLAVALFASAFLAGRTLGNPLAGSRKLDSLRALALVALFVILAAAIVTAAVVWIVQSRWNVGSGVPVQVTATQLLSAQRDGLLIVSGGSLLILVLGLTSGRRVHR
jgi:hypothetical protein